MSKDDSTMDSARVPTNRSMSFFSNVKGGDIAIVDPVGRTKTPLSKHRLKISPALLVGRFGTGDNSTAPISPQFLTSMTWGSPFRECSASSKYGARSLALLNRSCSLYISNVAIPAAMARGWPLYVYPWKNSICDPLPSRSAESIRVLYKPFLQITAPAGIMPLVRPFAHVIMSGLTSNLSAANEAPRRPKPVITSSKIRSIPCLLQISFSLFRYPTGGGRTPVEPVEVESVSNYSNRFSKRKNYLKWLETRLGSEYRTCHWLHNHSSNRWRVVQCDYSLELICQVPAPARQSLGESHVLQAVCVGQVVNEGEWGTGEGLLVRTDATDTDT